MEHEITNMEMAVVRAINVRAISSREFIDCLMELEDMRRKSGSTEKGYLY
jgi:hypothetical protein